MAELKDIIRKGAIEIRDERKAGANTALRIGALLLSIIDAIVDIDDADKKYVRKDKEDTAKEIITYLKGLKIGEQYVEGSSGGFLGVDSNGKIYLEVDRLLVRMKAYFESIEVRKKSFIGGEEIISPAGGIVCTKVEELAQTYRCYFCADDGDMKVDNYFAAGDLAISKEFNIKEGIYEGVANAYYWRAVIEVGDDYVDLSKTDCDTNSDVPQKGDTICHFGNKADKGRQAAIVLSTVNENAPCITLYAGIDSYSLTDKEYIVYGVNKTTGRAFHKVYGDCYVGDRAEKNYIKLENDVLTVCAKLISQATGKSVDEMMSSMQDSIQSVKNQTDKQFTIWFGTDVPTLENAPTAEWNTEELKAEHLDDWYFVRSSSDAGGRAYRFEQASDKSFSWVEKTDKDTIAALEKAASASGVAGDAKTAAENAQKDANSANKSIDDISNDHKITAVEKIELKREHDAIVAEYQKNMNTAAKYALDSSAYKTGYATLVNYLDGILNDMTTTVDIIDDANGKNVKDYFAAYYTDRQTLLESVYAAAKKLSDDAQSTADGKMTVFVAQPVPPYAIGDMWTNASYNSGGITYDNDLLTCKTAKAKGASFDIADWKPADNATTAYIKNLGDSVKIEILGTDADGKTNTLLAAINADKSGVKIIGDKLEIDATTIANLIMASGLKVGVKDADGNFTEINCTIDEQGHITATDAVLTGKVNATSGKIGNLSIRENGTLYGASLIDENVGSFGYLYATSTSSPHSSSSYLADVIKNFHTSTIMLAPGILGYLNGTAILKLPTNAQIAEAGINYGVRLTFLAKGKYVTTDGGTLYNTYRIASNPRIDAPAGSLVSAVPNGEIVDGNGNYVDYIDLSDGDTLEMFWYGGEYHILSHNH